MTLKRVVTVIPAAPGFGVAWADSKFDDPVIAWKVELFYDEDEKDEEPYCDVRPITVHGIDNGNGIAYPNGAMAIPIEQSFESRDAWAAFVAARRSGT